MQIGERPRWGAGFVRNLKNRGYIPCRHTAKRTCFVSWTPSSEENGTPVKKSLPRRIAAGALFTAAVGISVGAIAAPAQADAFSPQHAIRTAAYAPDLLNHNGIRSSFDLRRAPHAEFTTRFGHDDPCGCSPDRTRGHDGSYSVWPLVGADQRSRVLQDDRRDCPPYRDHGRDGRDTLSSIVYTVHQAGDDHRRDCPPDRVRTSGYTVGHDIRVGDRRGYRGRR